MASKKKAVKKTAVKKTAAKKTAVKKSAVKKTAVKKSAVKKTAAKKTAVKKSAVKKSAVKKSAVKKTAVKKTTVKKSAVKKTAAKKSSTRIESITPSKNGTIWTVALAGGTSAQMSSASAQRAEIRVGGEWNAAAQKRVNDATNEQALMTRAMSELAKNGKTSKAAMVKVLGNDARANATVATLASNGWIA